MPKSIIALLFFASNFVFQPTAHALASVNCQAKKVFSDGSTFKFLVVTVPAPLQQLKVAIYPEGANQDDYGQLYDVVSNLLLPESSKLIVRGVLYNGLAAATITVLLDTPYAENTKLLKGVLETEKEVTDRLGANVYRKNQFELGCVK